MTSPIVTPIKPIRRSQAQWQSLVDQWQQSQLSAAAFCKANHIGYASFCQWRKRLTQQPERPTVNQPAFIDLSSLGPTNKAGWHIVLNLGDGLSLTLSQP